MESIPDISQLESLPNEILIPILLDIQANDILNLCRLSNRLRSLCNDWTFWAQKAEHDFNFPRSLFRNTTLQNPRYRYAEIRRERGVLLWYGIQAFKANQPNLIYKFIDEGLELNAALNLAVAYGNLPIVQDLIRRGADDIGQAVYSAVRNHQTHILNYLLTEGTREYGKIPTGTLNEALRIAGEVGNLDTIEYLLSHGATNIDSGLRGAASTGNLDLVKYFLDRGGDISTALVFARQNKQQNVYDYIIQLLRMRRRI